MLHNNTPHHGLQFMAHSYNAGHGVWSLAVCHEHLCLKPNFSQKKNEHKRHYLLIKFVPCAAGSCIPWERRRPFPSLPPTEFFGSAWVNGAIGHAVIKTADYVLPFCTTPSFIEAVLSLLGTKHDIWLEEVDLFISSVHSPFIACFSFNEAKVLLLWMEAGRGKGSYSRSGRGNWRRKISRICRSPATQVTLQINVPCADCFFWTKLMLYCSRGILKQIYSSFSFMGSKKVF